MSRRLPQLPRLVPLAALLAALLGGCDDEAPPDVPIAPSAPVESLATVQVIAGAVRLERNGQVLPPEATLEPGDVVITGPEASARLTLRDGREVELGSNARLLVGGSSGSVVLELGRGIVLARVPRGASGPSVVLELKTPYGLTRLNPGSEAEVDADSGRVEVRLGSVAFLGADGARLEAGEGQQVLAGAGGAPRVEPLAPVRVLRAMEIVLRTGGPGVQVRTRGTARWRTAPAKGTDLSEGDAVRTSRSRAVLAVGEGELALERGSEVVLGRIEGEAGLAHVDLQLARGALAMRSPEKPGQQLQVDGLELESRGRGLAQVRRTREGLEVEVVTGTFALSGGGEQTEVHGGSKVRLASATSAVAVAPMTAPALRLPARRGHRVLHGGLREVALGWDHPGPVQVEVASDAEFERILLAGRVDADFVQVPVPARGSLHWRARDREGREVGRGSASFGPERPPRTRARRNNEVPEGAQRTTVFFQSQVPALTFVWAEDRSAANYRLQLFKEGELAKPLLERSAKSTRLALEPGALVEGRYLWNVTPLAATGRALRGGRMSRLELTYDNAVPELVVETPKPGASVERGAVRTSGVAPVGSSLRVNGRRVETDAKGRFELQVRPTGSPGCIIFELSRPGVPDTYTVRMLRPRA